MHTRLLTIITVAMVSIGCSSLADRPRDPCAPGKRCALEGTLSVDSLWQASLDLPNSCFALALPKEFYSKQSTFNKKKVVVLGEAFTQPTDDPGTFSYWYEVEGLRVNANLCTMAIIVQEIREGEATIWRAGSDSPTRSR